MFKKIVLLMLSLTAIRNSVILGTPMDRYIGKYLGLSLAHAGGASVSSSASAVPAVADGDTTTITKKQLIWLPESELELRKVPWCFRGIAKRKIEKYAAEKGVQEICMVTLNEAREKHER